MARCKMLMVSCCFCLGVEVMNLSRDVVAFADAAAPDYVVTDTMLDALRRNGDVPAQRRHVWNVFSYVTHPAFGHEHGAPSFESWHGENELFGNDEPDHLRTGIRGFSRSAEASARDGVLSDVPVLSYTLYNETAYQHIRRYHLNELGALQQLVESGAADPVVAGDVTVPGFPIRSIVLKTVWWPVAQKGITSLPVWDPAKNPPYPSGNPYTSWSRVVALDPTGEANDVTTVSVEFAGRTFERARLVPLSKLYHVSVDSRMARSMMLDPETARAILISLGRPIKEGDYIAMVAANVMTREIPSWIWAAFWWHDQPEAGQFSAGRPGTLQLQWRNYLMQAAFDPQTPAAADNGPLICFNPWLEGRFPDGGHGSGVKSNCIACHERASYPQMNFLPVTRGAPDVLKDEAHGPGRLRTSFMWSLALHAKH
jgi:hypothetical protein